MRSSLRAGAGYDHCGRVNRFGSGTINIRKSRYMPFWMYRFFFVRNVVFLFFIFLYIYLIAMYRKSCKMITVQSCAERQGAGFFAGRVPAENNSISDKKGKGNDYERKISAFYVGTLRE